MGLCAVQIGLVDLLREFGLTPDGIIGHSVGELVCGYTDGCLDIKQTILASYFRGKHRGFVFSNSVLFTKNSQSPIPSNLPQN